MDRSTSRDRARRIDDQTRDGDLIARLDDVTLIVRVNACRMAATLHLEVGIGNLDRLVKVLVRQTGCLLYTSRCV